MQPNNGLRDVLHDEQTSVGKIALFMAKSGVTEMPLSRLLKQTSNKSSVESFKLILNSALGMEYFDVDDDDNVHLREQEVKYHKPGPGAEKVIDTVCAAVRDAGPCFVMSMQMRVSIKKHNFSCDGIFPSLFSAMRYAHFLGRVVLYGERGTIVSLSRKQLSPKKEQPTVDAPIASLTSNMFPPLQPLQRAPTTTPSPTNTLTSTPMPIRVSSPTSASLPDLKQFLDSISLGCYFKVLDDFGVSTVADIQLLTPEDFLSLGIKTFHQKKLMRAFEHRVRVVAITHSTLDGYACDWAFDGSTMPQAKALLFLDLPSYYKATNIDKDAVVYVVCDRESSSVTAVPSFQGAISLARERNLECVHVVMNACHLENVDEVMVYVEPLVAGNGAVAFARKSKMSLMAIKQLNDIVLLHYKLQ